MKKQYIIVRGIGADELQKLVNQELERGFNCLGGVATVIQKLGNDTFVGFFQAMEKNI